MLEAVSLPTNFMFFASVLIRIVAHASEGYEDLYLVASWSGPVH